MTNGPNSTVFGRNDGPNWDTIDSTVCRKDTIRTLARLLAAATAAFAVLPAQVAPQTPDWRHLGTSSVELMLASPATGPVDAVWFSADGTRLYARTPAGRTLETLDFENWTPAPNAGEPPSSAPAAAERLPAAGVKLVAFQSSPGRVYALGDQLYRSDDGGRSWSNLTAFQAESVIGGGQRSLAVAPNDPDQVVVANDFGVWRSLDGGYSWTGLNQGLPNLPAERILSVPSGTRGARILAGVLGVLELPAGAPAWQPATDTSLARELQLRRDYSAALAATITAVASAGDTVYTGASDGRLWVSFDRGRTWRGPSPATGGSVERLFVDATETRVAVAALSGPGPHVLRTTNSGGFWDDLTSGLPGDVHGIAADRASGALYAATDKGVFYASADLENAGSPQVSWAALTTRLPAAAATDVLLDRAGNQLYIALSGYGVYAAMAPHRASVLRVVNAADYSTRPAAPGGLLSVIGGRVSAARAGQLSFPVLAASDTESQIQVPFEADGPTVSLSVETGRGAVRFPVPVQPVAPAIFVSRDGTPMLLEADSGLMLDGGRTAHSGARIQVLATGLGKVRPDWPTGVPAPLENSPAVAAGIRAFVDRAPVSVTRAVLAPGYIGFYLVEIQLPAIVNAGPAELYLTADGLESNRVPIVLEP